MTISLLVNISKHTHDANLSIKTKARELRKNLTQSELLLWNRLRNKQMDGFHFRKQHPYGIYILDFYCYKANLAIELDGKIHLRKREYDSERTKYIESTGLKLIRFKNEDVITRIEWVMDEIRLHLTK
jgi:very-short-patch-repair endonuclease